MEPQHYYHNHNHHLHQIQTQNNGTHEDGGGGGGGSKNSGGGAGYICRQTSSRWTPTTEQIRILKELYYNNGVRSPSAEQIQRISAKLRQYGKIEGKNVFYWFQNHKARERQKKRLTTAAAPDAAAAFTMQMQRGVWRSAAADHHCSNFNNNIPQASTVGQIGNYGYGSTVAMERSFRNCSISAGGGGNGNGGYVAAAGNYGWVGIEHHHPYAAPATQYYHPFLDHKIRTVHHLHAADEDQETLEDVDQDNNYNYYDNKEPETLPLFPIHADHHTTAGGGGGCYYTNPDQWSAAGAAASLELSLNSSYNFGNTSSSLHFA